MSPNEDPEGPGSTRSPVTIPEGARYYLLSELLQNQVYVGSGTAIGKMQDLVFRDDPKYGEVSHLVVRRPFGRQPWKVPWEDVDRIEQGKVVLQEKRQVDYPDFEPTPDQLLLRDQVLDKRILDTKGSALDVVYDIQLVAAGRKLFVVAADVSRSARRRRTALFRRGPGSDPMGGQFEERIPWRYLQPIGPELTSTRGDVRLTIPRETLNEVRPEDLADILGDLSREQRLTLFNVLPAESAARTLEETEPRVQREILHDTEEGRVERIFSLLSPVAIAEILSSLPRQEAQDFGRLLKGEVATKVAQLMEKHEVPVSTFALPRFLAFPGFLTVAEAFERFRREAPKSDVTMYVYVVDPDGKVQGVVDINELLQASPESRLMDIMTHSVVATAPNADLASVLELFHRYRFRAIPVIDPTGKLTGVVREKDAFALERGMEFSGRRL